MAKKPEPKPAVVRLGKGAPRFDPLFMGCGAVLHFRGYKPEFDHGATRDAQRYMQATADEDKPWDPEEFDVAYYIALATRLVESWDNVYGEGTDPLPITPENMSLFMREIPGASVEFRTHYNSSVFRWNREGEASGVSPNGITDEAPPSAKDVTP
jgi:hypothetical protein